MGWIAPDQPSGAGIRCSHRDCENLYRHHHAAIAAYCRSRVAAADAEAVCLPGSYEPGTIHQSANLALTGACAELRAPLADDVA